MNDVEGTQTNSSGTWLVTDTPKSHKRLAEEATVALGCSGQAFFTSPAQSYWLNGCYDVTQGYSYNFNTTSSVESENFCYGGRADDDSCPSDDPPTCNPSATNLCVSVNYF